MNDDGCQWCRIKDCPIWKYEKHSVLCSPLLSKPRQQHKIHSIFFITETKMQKGGLCAQRKRNFIIYDYVVATRTVHPRPSGYSFWIHPNDEFDQLDINRLLAVSKYFFVSGLSICPTKKMTTCLTPFLLKCEHRLCNVVSCSGLQVTMFFSR